MPTASFRRRLDQPFILLRASAPMGGTRRVNSTAVGICQVDLCKPEGEWEGGREGDRESERERESLGLEVDGHVEVKIASAPITPSRLHPNFLLPRQPRTDRDTTWGDPRASGTVN